MLNDHYQARHYTEATKDTCHYCRRPALWQQVGNEKVCAHCGTRVFSPVMTLPTRANSNKRAQQ